LSRPLKKIGDLPCYKIGEDSQYEIFQSKEKFFALKQYPITADDGYWLHRRFVVEKESGIVHPLFNAPHASYWRRVARYILEGGDIDRRRRRRARLPSLYKEVEAEWDSISQKRCPQCGHLLVKHPQGGYCIGATECYCTHPSIYPRQKSEWMRVQVERKLREEGLLLSDEEIPDLEVVGLF